MVNASELIKNSSKNKNINIGIVGAGYVGITTGISFAHKGFNVSLCDTNQNIVENFFSLAFHKLREIIFGEETFFKENPSLKSPIVIIRSSILLIFYLWNI